MRKPRILSAVPASMGSEVTEVVRRQQQAAPPLAQLDRERLTQAREAIFRHQQVLHARLAAIDIELRAIDSYEAAKRAKDRPSSAR